MTVRTYPNQKPWITGNICTELKGRAESYKKSHYALRLTIKQAKRKYRTKIESYYTRFDTRRMWQGSMLFIDYSSAFNTIVPSKLITKLRTLGPLQLEPVLPDKQPQGGKGRQQYICHACVAKHDSNTIIKFSDAITVVCLITDNDEPVYREQVRALAVCCQDNNLSLKTKELIVDYRKRRAEQAPINIDGGEVDRVESFKFLGVHITNKLSWSKYTKTFVKRAVQHLFPDTRLKRFGMGPQVLKKLYSSISAWYGNCSASDRRALQRVLRTVQYITGAKLPDIQNLYTWWCQRRAQKIVKDSSHPSHRLFLLLPHGKRYRSAKPRPKRLLNSFYPQAIRPPLYFYTAATRCLLSMQSLYKLPQLTCIPAH